MRLFFALLGLVLVWPAVQMALAAALELDPSKFCGFAMYATPAFEQRVLMIELRGELEVHIHNTWLADPARNAYREYRKRRALLGRLAPPHELAEAILDERPEMRGLKIVVLRDIASVRTASTIALPGTAFIYRPR